MTDDNEHVTRISVESIDGVAGDIRNLLAGREVDPDLACWPTLERDHEIAALIAAEVYDADYWAPHTFAELPHDDQLKVIGQMAHAIRAARPHIEGEARQQPFQERCYGWAVACFGRDIVDDRRGRALRFLEEAMELAQSAGLDRDEALAVLAYVYSRPVEPEIAKEFGGVAVTMALMAEVWGLDIGKMQEAELRRCHQRLGEIRAKQAAKREAGVAVSRGME